MQLISGFLKIFGVCFDSSARDYPGDKVKRKWGQGNIHVEIQKWPEGFNLKCYFSWTNVLTGVILSCVEQHVPVIK